jgi:hypothetical protein
MRSSFLPRDDDMAVIPAVRLAPDGAHQLSITNTSVQNATAFDPATRVIGLYADGPVFIRFGDDNVTADVNDHYLPAHTYIDLAIGGGKVGKATYLAGIAAVHDCTLYLSEKL